MDRAVTDRSYDEILAHPEKLRELVLLLRAPPADADAVRSDGYFRSLLPHCDNAHIFIFLIIFSFDDFIMLERFDFVVIGVLPLGGKRSGFGSHNAREIYGVIVLMSFHITSIIWSCNLGHSLLPITNESRLRKSYSMQKMVLFDSLNILHSSPLHDFSMARLCKKR
jgi:hypothetical protein